MHHFKVIRCVFSLIFPFFFYKNHSLLNETYVSFSGGKDSTVLLHLVRSIYPDTPAVFIDTGLEYPEVRQFAMATGNVIILKPEMNFKRVIEKYGYPLISKEVSQKIYEARQKPDGVVAARFDPNNEHNLKYKTYSMVKWTWLRDSDIPISHKCCIIMKKKPAKKFEKETGLKPIIGTMAAESSLRKSEWFKNGCNAFDAKRPTCKPLSFWTEQDIFEYIKRYDLKIPSVYGDIVCDNNGKMKTTGCERTGCLWCPLGCHLDKEPNRFQKLKQTHPTIWKYCMKPWDQGGLGMKDVLEFIGVKTE